MKNLSDIVPGYPDDHPQTLSALVDAEPSQLTNDTAWALRKQALTVARSWEQHFITNPWDVLTMIVAGYVLHPWEKAWKSYALSSDRQPILVPGDAGRARYLQKATKLLPKVSDLPALPDTRGSQRPAKWLVIYGGSPDVLSKDGVVPGLARLAASKKVADIVFYDAGSLQGPTLWSTRAGAGLSGAVRASAQRVEFPDVSLIQPIVQELS